MKGNGMKRAAGAVLAAVMIGFRQLRGSRLSPILLILLSAVLGLAAYGGGIP